MGLGLPSYVERVLENITYHPSSIMKPSIVQISALFVFLFFSFKCERLCFNSDQTFKIVQFTDIHNFDYSAFMSQEVQSIVLKKEKPDLVVLTGDSICSNLSYDRGHEMYTKLVQPMVKSNTRWAMTFGNHDDGGEMKREEIMDLDQSFYPLSLSQFGPTNIPGVSNYHLEVGCPNDCNKTCLVLYMLATSDGGCEGHTGDGCLSTSQVQWYKELSTSLNVPFAFLFFHIPIPEFVELWNTEECVGSKEEHCCCPKVNTGLYDAALEMGDVKGMFCGHDHRNDYCGAFSKNPNLTLCYGRKTGFGYYNPYWPMHHGGRVISVEGNDPSNLKWTTWIRDDLGEKIVQKKHDPSGSSQQECMIKPTSEEQM